MGKGSLGLNPLFDSIIDTEQKEKNSQIIQFNQLEHDLQSQKKFLQAQDTDEMGVSKDALRKYDSNLISKKAGLSMLVFVTISVLVAKLANDGLKGIYNTPQQENIIQDTQDDMQHVLLIDTTDVIDTYKDTLLEDELQEFEQFSQEKQREQIQGRNK